jgi:zinc and cadmium transporter
MLWFHAIASVSLVSLISLCGVIAIPVSKRTIDKILFYLVALGTGAMLGNAIFHLIPESFEHGLDPMVISSLLAGGFLLCFMLEKVLNFRCHHSSDGHCQDDHGHEESGNGGHIHATGWMSLVSHGLDNFTDGVLIAVAWMDSPALGIATTLAIVLHEIPMEFGGFGILVNAGFSKKGAVIVNFGSALVATTGTILTLWLGSVVQGLAGVMTPFAGGMVFYIAAVGLIPRLQKETDARRSAVQFSVMIAGMLALMLVKFLG